MGVISLDRAARVVIGPTGFDDRYPLRHGRPPKKSPTIGRFRRLFRLFSPLALNDHMNGVLMITKEDLAAMTLPALREYSTAFGRRRDQTLDDVWRPPRPGQERVLQR